MNEPTLHPNLAKLAAAYDEILDRIGRGMLSAPAARAEIAQLEARDDQGVRWSIDPDTGEWVRRTAMGDYEYGSAPPTSGYMTPDAFDYTHNPQVFNPADRLQLGVIDDPHPYQQHAGGFGTGNLEGATRSLPPNAPLTGSAQATNGVVQKISELLGPRVSTSVTVWVHRLSATAVRTKIAAAAVSVLVLFFLFHSCAGGSSAPVAPTGKTPAVTKGTPRVSPGAARHNRATSAPKTTKVPKRH